MAYDTRFVPITLEEGEYDKFIDASREFGTSILEDSSKASQVLGRLIRSFLKKTPEERRKMLEQ